MTWPPRPLPRPPTAHTSVGERAVTALNWPPPLASLPVPFEASAGVAWTLQHVPLKNSPGGLPEPLLPTAQMSLADKTLMALSEPPGTVGAFVTGDQLV